jgi:hypothetical protein
VIMIIFLVCSKIRLSFSSYFVLQSGSGAAQWVPALLCHAMGIHGTGGPWLLTLDDDYKDVDGTVPCHGKTGRATCGQREGVVELALDCRGCYKRVLQ